MSLSDNALRFNPEEELPYGNPLSATQLDTLLGWVHQGPSTWPQVKALFHTLETAAASGVQSTPSDPAKESSALRMALHDLVRHWDPDPRGQALMQALCHLGASSQVHDADHQYGTVLHAALRSVGPAALPAMLWLPILLDLDAKADREDAYSVFPIDVAASLWESPMPAVHEAACWAAFDALASASHWRPGFNYGHAPAFSIAIALATRAGTKEDPELAVRGQRMLSSLIQARSPIVGPLPEAYAPLAWWWTCAQEPMADPDAALAVLERLLAIGLEPLLDTTFRGAQDGRHVPFMTRVLNALADESPAAPGFASRTMDCLFQHGLTLEFRHPFDDTRWIEEAPEAWVHHWTGATGLLHVMEETSPAGATSQGRRPRL